jgi:serine phosphatase RsbU (regulator of sigma subunit)
MTAEQFQEALETHVSVYRSAANGARAGGDWCEIRSISDETFALTIGDVAGHGKAVADTMAIMRAAIMCAIDDTRVPSGVLSLANEVALNWGDGILVTAIVAFVDRRLQTLTFANAGHPPPLLLTADGHAFLGEPPADIPLGLFPNYCAANYVVALPTDAIVAFYTDGITEHNRDPIGGEAELVEAARFAYARTEINVARSIIRQIFAKGRGGDDAAAIGLRTSRKQ